MKWRAIVPYLLSLPFVVAGLAVGFIWMSLKVGWEAADTLTDKMANDQW